MMTFGEHAREFVPVESFFDLLGNLTTGFRAPCHEHAGQFARFVLNNFELYVIGLVNPDGKAKLEQTQNYCWRGNGQGVDFERNFDWNYGGPASTGEPGSEEYRGRAAFSETESRFVRDLATDLRPDAFVSLHGGISQIYLPFADTRSKGKKRFPENYARMMKIATAMGDAVHGEFGEVGAAWKVMDYSADGTAFDYMAGVLKIPIALTIELWGPSQGADFVEDCFPAFNPPVAELPAVLNRSMVLYGAMLNAIAADIYQIAPDPQALFDPSVYPNEHAMPPSLHMNRLLHRACEVDERLRDVVDQIQSLSVRVRRELVT